MIGIQRDRKRRGVGKWPDSSWESGGKVTWLYCPNYRWWGVAYPRWLPDSRWWRRVHQPADKEWFHLEGWVGRVGAWKRRKESCLQQEDSWCCLHKHQGVASTRREEDDSHSLPEEKVSIEYVLFKYTLKKKGWSASSQPSSEPLWGEREERAWKQQACLRRVTRRLSGICSSNQFETKYRFFQNHGTILKAIWKRFIQDFTCSRNTWPMLKVLRTGYSL